MSLDTTIGSALADSYATLAEYTARASAMGWTLTGTSTTQEANLRRAALSLDQAWLQRSFGFRQYQTQAREFPRVWMPIIQGWPVNPDTIPQRIKDAQMELAYQIQGGADPLATFDGVIQSKRAKAGPVETETVYLGGKGRPSFTVVSDLVAPYLSNGSGQVHVVRA